MLGEAKTTRVRPRIQAVAATAPMLARVTALAGRDHIRAAPGASVPATPEAIGPARLTRALCAHHPGAEVTAVRAGDGSSGTTLRRRLHVEDNTAGAAVGLPATVFTSPRPGCASASRGRSPAPSRPASTRGCARAWPSRRPSPGEMLHRISTACADHESFVAVGV